MTHSEKNGPEMNINVHQRLCIASGNCGVVAPKVFANPESRDGFVKLLDAHPPEVEWAAVRQAEYLCPSGTIEIEPGIGRTPDVRR